MSKKSNASKSGASTAKAPLKALGARRRVKTGVRAGLTASFGASFGASFTASFR